MAASKQKSAVRRTGARGKKHARVSSKAVAAKAKKTAAKKKTAAEKKTAAKMAARNERAEVIAKAMPLVHYPASARFVDWSGWTGLHSKSSRGLAGGVGCFEALRHEHVFLYAGPCCYYHHDCVGDAVIYFAAGAEVDCAGCATAFDSGSLEDSPPRLQPFRKNAAPEHRRWRFFCKYRVPLQGWREHFADWLSFAYGDPDRYMDSVSDRYAAGQPDRTEPGYLLKENGTRGRKKYGTGECGDRRAWTWEIRVQQEMPFEQVATLHVPYDALESVSDFADEVQSNTGVRPPFKLLARDVVPSYEALYEESGAVLRELIKQ